MQKVLRKLGVAAGVGLISWSLVYVATKATHWRISHGEDIALAAAIGASLLVFSLLEKP